MMVLIAGAGIGGLTAALALHSAGIAARVFERSQDPGEAGAGIQISPNGMRILDALGLGHKLRAAAFRPEAVELRLYKSGRTVVRLPLGDRLEERMGFPYLQIHRGDFYTVLLEAVRARCGDVIHTGREVVGFRSHDNGVDVHFKDEGSESGSVLVGADGIHSRVREVLLGPDAPAFTGHVAWRGVAPAARLAGAGLKPVATSWMAPHSHAVTYFLRGGQLVNFVGVTEGRAWRDESWTRRGDKAALSRDFAGWHPEVRAVVEALDEPYQWALFERRPVARWSEGRVTLLGDACHAMLPYMAQGACTAIEDGAVLAHCLRGARRDIPGALKRYEGLRLERTARVQAAARANGKLFHLSGGMARFTAYGLMALASRLAPGMLSARTDWIWRYDALNAVKL